MSPAAMYSLQRSTLRRKVLAPRPGMNLELARFGLGGLAPQCRAQSRREFPLQRSNVAQRPVVGAPRTLARHVGGGDDVDLMPQVIKGQQPIEEHQLGVGQRQVIFRMLANLFQLADHVVGKVSDRARGEWRQSRNAGGPVLPQQSLHHLENVVLHHFAPASALNLDRSLAGFTRM